LKMELASRYLVVGGRTADNEETKAEKGGESSQQKLPIGKKKNPSVKHLSKAVNTKVNEGQGTGGIKRSSHTLSKTEKGASRGTSRQDN